MIADSLITGHGPGWRHLKGPVWEQKNRIRGLKKSTKTERVPTDLRHAERLGMASRRILRG